MSTLDDTICILQALKRYKDAMTPEERAEWEKDVEESRRTLGGFLKPNPLFETLMGDRK